VSEEGVILNKLGILLFVVCALALAACGGRDKVGEADVPALCQQ